MAGRKGRNRAGESALRVWRAQRRQTLRRDWRLWAALTVCIGALGAIVVVTHGTPQLISASLLGSMLTLALVGWMIGGDAHSLPWLWGQVGEQQTEEALKVLGATWCVVHDVPRDRGNWDHVAVGPSGVFLLETKSYRARAVASNDQLSIGRSVFKGSSFRLAAKHLGAALRPLLQRPPWIQPVVVIWGEFPQGQCEENGVVYLAGPALAGWLGAQPPRSGSFGVSVLAAALEDLRHARQ